MSPIASASTPNDVIDDESFGKSNQSIDLAFINAFPVEAAIKIDGHNSSQVAPVDFCAPTTGKRERRPIYEVSWHGGAD